MNFTRNQIIALTGCAITFLGIFLPMLTITVFTYSKSFNYFSGDGKFVLIFLIIEGILVFMDRNTVIQLIMGILSGATLTIALVNGGFTMANELW